MYYLMLSPGQQPWTDTSDADLP